MPPALSAVKWVDLPTKRDNRGSLTIVSQTEVPFAIARLFYLYGMDSLVSRGGHAHRVTEQLVVPVAGRFVLDLTDGRKTESFVMENPARGIYVPPMIWDHLHEFSSEAVCLVIASTQYSESDYIRNWEEFLAIRGYAQP